MICKRIPSRSILFGSIIRKLNIKIFLFFLSIFFTAAIQFAWCQLPFARTIGGSGIDSTSSIITTSDGGFIAAGYTDSFGSGDKDLWVVKSDSGGNIQWQKTYGGFSTDEASSIAQTFDGGFIVAGDTESFGAGVKDLWLLKLDSSGNIQWQKTYGGPSSESASSIATTSDGGFIVVALTGGLGFNDLWLLKLNSSGSIQWQKTYDDGINNGANSIATTSDGGFVVAGYNDSASTAHEDLWVLKFDSSGVIQWQKTYGGPLFDSASSIATTTDGGFIVVGDTDSFGNGAWALKLDANGNIQWQKSLGTPSNSYSVSSTATTADGGYVVAGRRSNAQNDLDALVLKLDMNGNVLWQKTYGGTEIDRATSIVPTSNGGFIVAGVTESFGAGNSDSWVLKLNSDGEISGSCSFINDISDASSNEIAEINDSTVVPSDLSFVPDSTTVSAEETTATMVEQCAPSCLFCDDFEDGMMSGDWEYGNGSWLETGGSLIGTDTAKDKIIATPAFAGCLNCTITAVMSTSDGIGNTISLFGWYVNRRNNVQVTLKENQDKLVFKQKINGITVLKQSVSVTIVPDQFYELQVSFDGTQFHVAVDGTTLLTVSPPIIPFGTVGFEVRSTTGNFLNISVY